MNYGGLILTVLIGVLVAWGWQAGRKGLSLPVKGKHWWVVVVIVVVVLFLIYGASSTPHTPVK
jgi:predicted CDP-diglyceride synthetase/phosphatidate cytidylyltransferase